MAGLDYNQDEQSEVTDIDAQIAEVRTALAEVQEAGEFDEFEGGEYEDYKTKLAAHVEEHWQINRDAREEMDEILMQCMRQRNGIYDPEDLQMIRESRMSEIYMSLSAAKIRNAVAWISDILLTPGELPWSIDATPNPELPDELQSMAEQELMTEIDQATQAGAAPSEDQVRERAMHVAKELRKKVKEEAAKKAENMARLIADQMEEGDFRQTTMAFIEDFCTFPTAYLKGPEFSVEKDMKWDGNEAKVIEKVITRDRRVSPFDVFPAPHAECVNDGTFIELVRYSRDELYSMMFLDYSDEECIREILSTTAYGRGRSWLWDDQELRLQSEGHGDYYEKQDNLIEGLHCWTSVSGEMLTEWGIEGIEDQEKDYQVECIMIDGKIIAVRENPDPLGKRPYYAASFQSTPGNLWGKSIPQLIRDVQRMVNATARALSNNLGLASGPQIFVLEDRLPEGEPITDIYPNKIWSLTTDPSGANIPPVQFQQVTSNAQELIAVYEHFERKADVLTGIPAFTPNDQQMAGVPETAQGLAMRLEAAVKGLRQAMLNIDIKVFTPRLKRQYRDNLMYINDPSIKGDVDIAARGATALIGRAAAQARRNEFLMNTANPVDMELVGMEGRAKVLRDIAKDLQLPDIIPSVEEIQAKQMAAQQAAAQGQEQDPKVMVEQMRMQSRLEDQKMESELAMQEMASRERIAMLQARSAQETLTAQQEVELEKIAAKMTEVALKERGSNERLVAEKKIKEQMGSGI